MSDLPEKPVTRKEQYLSAIAGAGQGYPEKPLTREEQYLAYIAENGGTGGGGAGAAAGFGKVTATIVEGVGTPNVDVTTSGPNTAKNFSFAFANLNGKPGEPGKPGDNGFSPTVEVEDIVGGHKVIITDAEGPKEFNVMDGSGEGVAFTTDETLDLSEENVLSVAVPTKRATKAEFASMSDEEKKGFVVVTDEAASGGGTSEEVYSLEEKRIGTWIDGKPLYRRVFQAVTGKDINTHSIMFSWKNLGIELITRISGIVLQSNGARIIFPYYNNGTTPHVFGTLLQQYNGNTIEVHSYSDYNSCPIIVITEYTKTTDAATIDIQSSAVRSDSTFENQSLPTTSATFETEVL